MTSIRDALESAALAAVQAGITTTTTAAPEGKKRWVSRRAWRCDPIERKAHFDELRADRKERWKSMRENGIAELVGWTPPKWMRYPRVQRLSMRNMMTKLLHPSEM